MANRFFAIILLTVYATIICGITINLHYCGGKLASVNLSIADSEHPCACGSKGMKKGCCENKSIYVQYKADQKVQYFAINFNHVVKDIFIPFLVHDVFLPPFHLTRKEEVSHSPPPLLASSSPTYLLNRVFRI